MKKLLVVFTVAVALAAGAAVAAEQTVDGAALYKARCAGCHGVDGAKAPTEGVKPLKGQSEADAYKKMTGYVDGTYGGAKKMGMVGILKSFKDDDLKALAKYIGSL